MCLTRFHAGLLILILAVAFGACDSPIAGDVEATFIRLHNASEYDFKNVEINTCDSPADFGDIKSGEKTDYQSFEIAYRYAYVRLFVDSEEFIIQPIDYVGETPLGLGFFTYKLEVVDFENRILNITAIED
ncbi:hypothetical protein GWO43_02400 [candidate division KSB1 bacterium]|nr:hypothetical protein [candidate division KSB1 bacterium]NIR69716.1 hypothetical protein [candidate division KSB1 bacterium]NIS22904.1 hypothetical protein [candidate division KSB1 bacterium]NIT69761.1 hypothetical protein [candidate division KSB1 bacterium]NIU23435.1 hypothetical protein [candidate division KSB1 bacterium]